jgi:hypothetical protein
MRRSDRLKRKREEQNGEPSPSRSQNRADYHGDSALEVEPSTSADEHLTASYKQFKIEPVILSELSKRSGHRDERFKESEFATTVQLCNICRRMDIEAISSPDGYLHVTKSSASLDSCPLCKRIFSDVDESMKDIRAVVKITSAVSEMGAYKMYLDIRIGTQCTFLFDGVVTYQG